MKRSKYKLNGHFKDRNSLYKSYSEQEWLALLIFHLTNQFDLFLERMNGDSWWMAATSACSNTTHRVRVSWQGAEPGSKPKQENKVPQSGGGGVLPDLCLHPTVMGLHEGKWEQPSTKNWVGIETREATHVSRENKRFIYYSRIDFLGRSKAGTQVDENGLSQERVYPKILLWLGGVPRWGFPCWAGLSGLNFSLWRRDGDHELSITLPRCAKRKGWAWSQLTVRYKNQSQTLYCGMWLWGCVSFLYHFSYHMCAGHFHSRAWRCRTGVAKTQPLSTGAK